MRILTRLSEKGELKLSSETLSLWPFKANEFVDVNIITIKVSRNSRRKRK